MIPIARWSSTATASPSAAGARRAACQAPRNGALSLDAARELGIRDAQDILDLAYYSGWRKNEILGLTWDEIDEAGGVIRLSPARSMTWVGRILPISPPIADALARRRARRDPTSPLVFHHDGIPVRCWRTTSVETWQTWPMNSASTWLQDAYPTTWESSPK